MTMNAAQLNGCRMIHDEMHGCETKGNMVEVMTAREMAETPHDLKGSNLAYCKDGRKFGWSNHLESWVRYE